VSGEAQELTEFEGGSEMVIPFCNFCSFLVLAGLFAFVISCLMFFKPRATLCVFSHAKVETTSSKGVHCTR